MPDRVIGIEERIDALAAPILENLGAFLVEARVRGENRGKVLEMFIDTDRGVTTQECATASRELSKALDAAEVIRGSYQLVVSSPGIDSPLKFFRQFAKNVGRVMVIRCRDAGNQAPVEGVLVEIEGETIILRTDSDGGMRRIPYSEIAEARVKPPW